jgi:hypothetical protein
MARDLTLSRINGEHYYPDMECFNCGEAGIYLTLSGPHQGLIECVECGAQESKAMEDYDSATMRDIAEELRSGR